MRILHCVEFYHPSPGGAQAVVRQVSEKLAERGHSVTVATTRLAGRRETELNGVAIEEFEIEGNTARGINGEVERYRDLAVDGGFDVLMTYAAQQWTTDALLPVLDRIPAAKLLAPCGFSGLNDPAYREYFERMPGWLAGFDRLIFHSSAYRDVEFAREAGLDNISVIPNGAARDEFGDLASEFRERHGVEAGEPLLLTVGPHNFRKGHRLAIDAFREAGLERGTLVIVGNRPLRLGCQWDCRRRALAMRAGGRRRGRVLLLDLPRAQVLAAYKAADLFVFGSQIECSPLVLFEAAASATPFVSVACGNAEEIAQWTGAGTVVPTRPLDGDRVTADPEDLAAELRRLWRDPGERERMANTGRERWQSRFTWEQIAGEYERAYSHAHAGLTGAT